MIDKESLKDILNPVNGTDIVVGVSTDDGTVSCKGYDRYVSIMPLSRCPGGDVDHLITTVKINIIPSGRDCRYKEMSLTSHGLLLLYIALQKYLCQNKMWDFKVIESEEKE